MKPRTLVDRETAILVIGEAPMLSSYLAELRRNGTHVEFLETVDAATVATVRSHRRTVLTIGTGIKTDTKQLTALSQLRSAGAILVSADAGVSRIGDVELAPVLPWANVAWFVVETYRLFDASAAGRVDFARGLLGKSEGREWLADALMACPQTIEKGARQLGMSPRSLTRRIQTYDVTWHHLGDGIVLAVCASQACADGTAKESTVAIELGFRSSSALSRRLRCLGAPSRRGTRDH